MVIGNNKGFYQIDSLLCAFKAGQHWKLSTTILLLLTTAAFLSVRSFCQTVIYEWVKMATYPYREISCM